MNENMKNISTVVYICFGVTLHFSSSTTEVASTSLNFPELVRSSNSIVMNEKRQTVLDSSNTMNYPNPSGSTIIILYKITTAGNVTINFLDLLGRQVYEYEEGYKEAGESITRIDLDFLNSGVYFYEIRVDGRRQAINSITVLK